MQIIETLSDHIEEEIHDAMCYAKLSLKVRDEYPELARTLHTLAEEEMSHMTRLHEQVVRIIEEYKEQHGDPPPAMMAVYEYLHKKHVDKAAEARAVMAMYK